MKPKDCPPAEFTFHYGAEESFNGEALEVFRCGMYLMLDYRGELDSNKLFEEMALGFLREPAPDEHVVQALVVLLTYRLVTFDEGFYDEALSRLFEIHSAIHLDQPFLDDLAELLESLDKRGFPLDLVAKTPEGSRILAAIRSKEC